MNKGNLPDKKVILDDSVKPQIMLNDCHFSKPVPTFLYAYGLYSMVKVTEDYG